MTSKKILMAVLLACACAPALAEELEIGEQIQRIVTRSTDTVGLQLEHALGLDGNATVLHLGPGKLVKNAPYSAEMVAERSRTLGDGNEIVHKSSSMSYRDSAGRTRTETRNNKGEVVSVMIDDPVAGTRYLLRPRDKSATKITMPNLAALAARAEARAAAGAARMAAAQARVAGEGARIHVETLRREGKLGDGERVIVKQVERRGGAEGEHRDVSIRIAQTGAGPVSGEQLGLALASALDKRKTETRDLGSRDFNGVKASGTERSYEIPAGEIGNRLPIVVSTETWTSPELQVVVYQKRSDPRAGDSVLRLEDLKREEPAAALFTLPSDYTVRDPLAAARAKAEKNSR